MSLNTKDIFLSAFFFIFGLFCMFLYMNHTMQARLDKSNKMLTIDQKLIDDGKNEGLAMLECRGLGCSVVDMTKLWGKYDDERQKLEQQRKDVSGLK